MDNDFYRQQEQTPDTPFDISLRPHSFDDFIGQEKIKERLLLMLQAALQRGDVLDHQLLSGPPGLGKTTLAHILARGAGTKLHCTSGPQIEKAGDLAGLLTNLARGDFLFIDEIHRLHPAVEEYLYPAMEDFRLDIIIDQGPNARSLQLDLPPFTLVGATTRAGMLTSPLRSRFGMPCRLEYYTHQQIARVVRRSAEILGAEIEPAGALEIARRSRGTPRIANHLLRWVRDFAQVRAGNRIEEPVAIEALAMVEIDEDGLDELDIALLEALVNKFHGGPVGLATLAVAVGEDVGTIEEVKEPYLILQGFLQRTPRGRTAMPQAYHKLGLTPPSRALTPDLFSSPDDAGPDPPGS